VLITMMVDELDEANSSKIEIEHHQIWARAMIRASKIGNSELLRFIHRENECNCLREHYYQLKDTTKRTSGCLGCLKHFYILDTLEC
jgi:hypothetical protein